MPDVMANETIESKIVKFFKQRATTSQVMLSIPDVMKGLNMDRRKAENSLLLLAKGKDPKLVEFLKGRVKLYTLREIVDFAQRKWREEGGTNYG